MGKSTSREYSVLSPISGDRHYEPGETIRLPLQEARPLLATGIIGTESATGSGVLLRQEVGEFMALFAELTDAEIDVVAREIVADETLTARILQLQVACQQAVDGDDQRAQKIFDAATAILATAAPEAITKAGVPTLAALRTESGFDDLTKAEVDAALRAAENAE